MVPLTALRWSTYARGVTITLMSKRAGPGADPFTVLVEQDEDGYFVATVPELRGCHTQAKSLDVLMRRVAEAIALCLIDSPRRARRTFVAVQQVQVA
jgi:predicted RNase H-like HicB family nuclease